MALSVAGHWFETRTCSDGVTLIWEPHVIPDIRCNIWHVRGRDRDLLLDSGMGLASLKRHVALTDPVVALGLERDGLPVLDQDVRVKHVAVLRGNHLELVVQVVLTGWMEPVATGYTADAVAHRQIRNNHQEVRRE